MTIPHLLVHDEKDTVGVVVVENLKAGTDMTCVVTANDSAFALTAKMDVPGLAIGDHDFTATYNGSATFASSTSLPLTVTVGPAASVTR